MTDENLHDLNEDETTDYSILFRDSHALMLVIDPADGAIIEANPAACDYYGYSKEQMCAMKMSQINTLTHEQIILQMQEAREENRNRFLFTHRLSDGQLRNVEVYSGPIVIKGRELFYSIIHDITERILAEEEIKKLNRMLKDRVTERTMQLEYINLRLMETNASLEAEISDRIAMENRLETAMEEVEDLYENAPCGYHSLDRDGMITRINKTELEWLGYQKEEVKGIKKYIDFITEESKKIFYANYPEFKKRGWVKDLELDIIRRDGSIMPVLVSGVAIYDADGNFISTRSTVYDNTQKKRAEEELKKLNSCLEATVEDRTRELVESHEALETVNKKLKEEINERIKIQNDLSNQNQLLNMLLENVSFGISMIEAPSGRPLFINERAKRLTGREAPPDASTGKLFEAFQVFHYGTGLPYRDEKMPIVRGINGERSHVDDMMVKHPDGRQAVLEVFGTPVKDAKGNIWASLVTFSDITDRKMSQEQIKALNERLVEANRQLEEMNANLEASNTNLEESNAMLEEEIAERQTAERMLAELNTQLENKIRERTKKLEDSVKEMEAFSYAVSHDLRAPLRSMSGFSRMLLEEYGDQLDDVAKHYLERLYNANEKMGQLIDGLLNISQLNRKELSHGSVDLSAIVRLYAEQCIEAEPERKVIFNIADGLIDDGDNVLLQTVLTNLMSNAWKYTRKKDAAQIEFGAAAQDSRERVYFVRDNGVGFDMKFANKLFSPFQRLHQESEYEGLGIGLSTVHRIIDRHGGRIWVDSSEGEGTTFYFTLKKDIE